MVSGFKIRGVCGMISTIYVGGLGACPPQEKFDLGPLKWQYGTVGEFLLLSTSCLAIYMYKLHILYVFKLKKPLPYNTT